MATRTDQYQGQHRSSNSYGRPAQRPAHQTHAQRIDIAGAYNSPDEVKAVLEGMDQSFHILGAITFGQLPEGFSVSMSTLKIDANADTYDVGGGKCGIGAAAMRRIAGAAGVTDLSSTCEGWATNYAAWKVTIGRLELDGTFRRATGNRVMDLREGSSQTVAMRDKVRAQNAKEPDRSKWKDPDGQLREQRLHIAAHAETKAWMRALRTLLGIRTYTKVELQKPFVVAKLQFTGRTNDPQLKVMFAHGLMSAALGSVAQLYGAPTPAPFALGSGAPPPPQLGFFGVGAPPPALDDLDEDGDGGPVPANATPAAPPRNPPSDRGHAAPDAQPAHSGIRMPGRGQKPLVVDAENKDLEYWGKRLNDDLENGNVAEQYYDRTVAQRDAIFAEMKRRRGEDQEPPPDDGAPNDDDPDGYGDRANGPM